VCLLTPKAGVIPPMMTVLMSFQREVWTMTAITCVLVTVIYFAAAALDTHRPGPTGCDLGLEIYRMFIGAPTNRIFAYSCRRILTSFCLFFTLVILNAFQVTVINIVVTNCTCSTNNIIVYYIKLFTMCPNKNIFVVSSTT